jgi:HK97 gp10 family phage protein
MAKGFEIKGIKEIEQVLAGLPGKFGNEVVEKVLNEGAKPLIKQAKENASHSDVTGNLSKAIGSIKNKKEGQTNSITVGPRRNRPHKGHHAHLIEYGTAPRKVQSKKVLAGGGKFFGKTVAGVTANPFLRPAYDAKIGDVQNEIVNEFRSILQSGFRKVFK